MKAILPWILAALSGLTLALAMPGPGLAPLALVFPILLMEALERSEGRWRPWVLGWVAGAVFWAVSTNWVVPVMHHYGGLPRYLAVNALFGMALVLGLFWAVAAGLAAQVPAQLRIWLLPAAWTSVLYLQRFPPFGFTWTDGAAAFVEWPWMMKSLAVWGSAGLTWWIAALGTSVWGLARSQTRLSAGISLGFTIALIILAVTVAPTPRPSGETITMAVLQPGTTLEEKWDPSQARVIADRVWALTGAVAVRGADMVLWPESAVPFRVDTDMAYREAVEKVARELDLEIVLNAIGDSEGGGYSNSAYLVTSEGLSDARYDKIHLVPFGEFVPGWARVAFSDSLVREVGSFTPGVSPVILPGRASLGLTICFEVVFSSLVAAQVKNGAEVLATLTNDGWYGFSWAPLQHFSQVRLRAAENQRWFARAALTGISGFIDPYGAVVSALPVGENGFLVREVQPMDGLTPSARFGDWWVQLCALAAGAMLVESRLRRRHKEKD